MEYQLPDTVQALLWAYSSPDDFGAREISPLAEAIRSGDDLAVSQLLMHSANPSRREDGNNDLVFLAIQLSFAEQVHPATAVPSLPQSERGCTLI